MDEEALVQALRSGIIAGAGLDVLEKEPATRDDPLFGIPGITITPHAGAGTTSSHREQVANWLHVIEDFLEGRHPLHNQVNPGVQA